MMKLVLYIMTMIAGVAMLLPEVVSRIRGLTEKGRHFYLPDAHFDSILVIGSTSIGVDWLVEWLEVYVAALGAVLLVVGVVGTWRALRR